MTRPVYEERDHAFGQSMLTLRSAMGMTQARLAEELGVSSRAIGGWEAGSSYPKVSHLQHLIVLSMQQQAFSPGYEAQEIRALWQAAHQKVRLDEQWLASLLGQPSSSPPPPTTPRPPLTEEETLGQENAFPHPPTITGPSPGPRV